MLDNIVEILKSNTTDYQSFQTNARTVLIIILNSSGKEKGKECSEKSPTTHPKRLGNYDLTVEIYNTLPLMTQKKQLFYLKNYEREENKY